VNEYAERAQGQNGQGGLDDHIYQRLLKERIIFLGSEVRDQNANAICAQMLVLNAEDPTKDIWLYINSPGGSVDSGLAIYDTMQFISNDVATVAMGLAASMGQFLLAAGTKGKRFALPHSRVLIHQPSGGAGGQAVDIEIQAREILRYRRLLDEILSIHTGQTVEKVSKDSDRDFIMTADEAKAYGIIDEIITSRKELEDAQRVAAISAAN
jgi:ATP-dependent Clp protease protease subunit